MSPLSGVTHFSAVLFVITIKNVFTCSPRHTVLLSRPQLWSNDHEIHTTEYVIKHRYSHYISLVNIQISTSFNNWSNISVRQGCTCKWTVPRDCTNTSQWRCHNWSYETRGMKELMYYCTRTGCTWNVWNTTSRSCPSVLTLCSMPTVTTRHPQSDHLTPCTIWQ